MPIVTIFRSIQPLSDGRSNGVSQGVIFGGFNDDGTEKVFIDHIGANALGV